MNFLNKILSVIFSIIMLSTPVLALELDLSVDEDIRKNYNPSKLETETLPPLPSTAPNKKQTGNNNLPHNNLPQQNLPPQKYPVSTGNYMNPNAVRLKKGTKFKVRSNQAVSSSTAKGNRITFTSIYPVALKGSGRVVPAGTLFQGEIVDSHAPQITGNGGLIVMLVDGITYGGGTTRIEAKITKASSKKIFLNNIKGERGYLKGVARSIRPGKKFYNTMMRWTHKLSNLGVLVILTPFTVIPGVLVYGVNIVGSPFFAIFSKGSSINIPAGTEYEIKVLEDAFI